MKRRRSSEHYKVIEEKPMSDTVLALGITVLLLAALAAWVPLLHLAERLTRKSAMFVARELPESQERVSGTASQSFEREIA